MNPDHSGVTNPKLWRFLVAAAALAVSTGLALPAAAQQPGEVVDKSTGTRFMAQPTIDGTTYHCLGAGVRKVFAFKAYAVAYCVGDASIASQYAREAYPQMSGKQLADALENDPRFFDTISAGPSNRLVAMQMVRDVSRQKLSDAFRESLSTILPPEKIDRLLAAIPGDAKKGQQALLYTNGQTLVIDIGGQANRLEDPVIAEALWRVWLGPDSVSPSLKESIAENVAQQQTGPRAIGGGGQTGP